MAHILPPKAILSPAALGMPATPVILYHYEESPYSKLIQWYLNLRRIPYYQTLKSYAPVNPDLKSCLGIQDPSFPVLCIGRDVYYDVHIMMSALDRIFPPSSMHPNLRGNETWRDIADLLRDLVDLTRGDLENIIATFPSPYVGDAAREGKKTAAESVRKYLYNGIEVLLTDGRWWVENTQSPTLLDLHLAWPLYWLCSIPDAFPSEFIDKASLRGTFAWFDRFKQFIEAPHIRYNPPTLEGYQAAIMATEAPFAEPEGNVPPHITQHFQCVKGSTVQTWRINRNPTTGDKGKLVSMEGGQGVIEVEGMYGSIRLHMPSSKSGLQKVSD
ncbi:hypothetical protein F4805DRAFT_472051 [Annulohypoxylon moriforme]|nr:hypothetical protein F4805DRAFT_472051 [Annulohypoxylon moriforme]